MQKPIYYDLGADVFCIDALYTAADIACCYLVRAGDQSALIETGTANSVENILATLDELDLAPEQIRYIIPTHVHLDHAGGAGQLMQVCPNAELLIHPRGARHMTNPERLIASSRQVYGEALFTALYGEILAIEADRVRTLHDGESVFLAERELLVCHTRGHADHHFCLFDYASRGWFSGDMFGISYQRHRFAAGSFVMPATTPTQFDPALYRQSIDLLTAQNPLRFYLTHFGALPFSPEQATLLKRQLDSYEALGKTVHGSQANHGASLEARVLAITEAELAQLISPDAAAAETAALSMDAKLNAQGIGWWAQQRSESPARATQ